MDLLTTKRQSVSRIIKKLLKMSPKESVWGSWRGILLREMRSTGSSKVGRLEGSHRPACGALDHSLVQLSTHWNSNHRFYCSDWTLSSRSSAEPVRLLEQQAEARAIPGKPGHCHPKDDPFQGALLMTVPSRSSSPWVSSWATFQMRSFSCVPLFFIFSSDPVSWWSHQLTS